MPVNWQSYRRPAQYARIRIRGNVRNMVWTILCVAGTLVILGLLIKWCTPWFKTLGETILQ